MFSSNWSVAPVWSSCSYLLFTCRYTVLSNMFNRLREIQWRCLPPHFVSKQSEDQTTRLKYRPVNAYVLQFARIMPSSSIPKIVVIAQTSCSDFQLGRRWILFLRMMKTLVACICEEPFHQSSCTKCNYRCGPINYAAQISLGSKSLMKCTLIQLLNSVYSQKLSSLSWSSESFVNAHKSVVSLINLMALSIDHFKIQIRPPAHARHSPPWMGICVDKMCATIVPHKTGTLSSRNGMMIWDIFLSTWVLNCF